MLCFRRNPFLRHRLGGPCGIRTHDPLIKSQVHYRCAKSPKLARLWAKRPVSCSTNIILSYRDAPLADSRVGTRLVADRIRTGDPEVTNRRNPSLRHLLLYQKKVYPTGLLTTCNPRIESRCSVTSQQGQLSPCLRLDEGIGYPQEDTEVSSMGTVCPLLTSLGVGLPRLF